MTKIEQNVMASVAAIYAFRLATGLTALKIYALVASAIGITLFVSLGNVVQNLLHVAASGGSNVPVFIVSAVFSTTLVVQLALILGVGAALSLFVDVVRVVSSRRTLFA